MVLMIFGGKYRESLWTLELSLWLVSGEVVLGFRRRHHVGIELFGLFVRSFWGATADYGSVLRLPSSSPRTRGIDILAWNGSVISWCKASPKDSWARMEIRRWAISSTRNAQHSDSALAGWRAVHLPCDPFPPPTGTDMDPASSFPVACTPALCSATSRSPPTLADAFACPWGNSAAPSDVPVYRGILSSGMGRTGESARPFPTLVPRVYASKIYPPRPRRTSPPHLQGLAWGRERGEEKEDANEQRGTRLSKGIRRSVMIVSFLPFRGVVPGYSASQVEMDHGTLSTGLFRGVSRVQDPTCGHSSSLRCYGARVVGLQRRVKEEKMLDLRMGVSTSKLDAVHVEEEFAFESRFIFDRVLLADASGMEFASFDAWPQAIDVLSKIDGSERGVWYLEVEDGGVGAPDMCSQHYIYLVNPRLYWL
ncbi:hypothetical protein DFP72DRAFT_854620 [Ephemerocybe angulata]|uniref:Uncharacterized protein n=1 Tax=Ephemerocybe angulata TaxID=980116 RepID=A0A8H6HHX3_9AGAR|nr:hypothetical protein DFP72DRAFT_854620 [Tulosesus angulatus]